jgi:hypothetical protein
LNADPDRNPGSAFFDRFRGPTAAPERKQSPGERFALEHDPDPKGRVSAKWEPVFPQLTNAERVCAEIMLKQRDDAMPLNRIMI